MIVNKLKEIINKMDAPELQELILVLNSKSKEVKTLLDVYFGSVDIDKEFQTALDKVEKCFKRKGDYKMSRPKLKDAKKYIADFKKLFGNRDHKVLELNLYYCELIIGMFVEFGGGDENWEYSMDAVFEDCCKYIKEFDLESLYLKKLKELDSFGGDYFENLNFYINEFFITK